MELSRKQAQEIVGKLGNFKVKAMSGGYCALWLGKTQLATWVTPAQALAMAQDAKSVIERDNAKRGEK